MGKEGAFSSAKILLVDDNVFVLETTAALLKEWGYLVEALSDPEEAIVRAKRDSFDAVLTDIKMPKITGIELLERVREFNKDVPVVLMTAYAELDVAVDAIHKGAHDFILKPFKAAYLRSIMGKAVNYHRLIEMEKNYKKRLEEDVRKRTQELAEALHLVRDVSKEITQRLVTVSGFRDTETGAHIRRIGLYSGVISKELDMPRDFTETIMFASPMHDLGKVGISDEILFKPGPLTKEEFAVMKTHTTIGAKMLADSMYPGIQMAARIALNHHERYDGTGYPAGLKGEDIPIEGRIVMLTDQYDALRSKRPYKNPLTHKETLRIILEGDRRTMPEHFDPAVLDVFRSVDGVFNDIFEEQHD